MRSAIAARTGWTTANRPLVVAVGLLLALETLLVIAGLLLRWDSLLRGWLVAVAIWSSVPVGSMALLLIHSLTGGAWGFAAAPTLRPAAAMMPLVALAFVPVLVAAPHIYPWAAEPSAIPRDVAQWYLNVPSFVVRAVIALGGWSLLGILFAASSGSRLLAALGLAFFGLTISLVAVDWYLSLEPHYVASAFAAMIAIQQLLMALAAAAVVGSPEIDGKVAGDLGGLLIATLLGVVYLDYMTFVVAWYGDLPDKAEWFLKRSSAGWIAVLVTALVVGAILPFAMLLVKDVRRSARGLRIAGALILFGSVLHFAWLLVPAFDARAGVIAAACVSVVVLALMSVRIGAALVPVLETRRAE